MVMDIQQEAIQLTRHAAVRGIIVHVNSVIQSFNILVYVLQCCCVAMFEGFCQACTRH